LAPVSCDLFQAEKRITDMIKNDESDVTNWAINENKNVY
jgi:hypothetical protein